MLARFIKGESIDDLTRNLGLESGTATRSLLRKAMVQLQRRYVRDR